MRRSWARSQLGEVVLSQSYWRKAESAITVPSDTILLHLVTSTCTNGLILLRWIIAVGVDVMRSRRML